MDVDRVGMTLTDQNFQTTGAGEHIFRAGGIYSGRVRPLASACTGDRGIGKGVSRPGNVRDPRRGGPAPDALPLRDRDPPDPAVF